MLVNNLRCAFSSEGAQSSRGRVSERDRERRERARNPKSAGLLFQTVLTKLSELGTICMRSTFAHIIQQRARTHIKYPVEK
jgi:hypothetical protein